MRQKLAIDRVKGRSIIPIVWGKQQHVYSAKARDDVNRVSKRSVQPGACGIANEYRTRNTRVDIGEKLAA